jgi:hypothetical protein
MKINRWTVLAGTLILLVSFAYFAMFIVQVCFIALVVVALYSLFRGQGISLERAVYQARLFLYRHL